MKKVSDQQEKHLNNLETLLLKMKKRGVLKDFLKVILTPKELEEIPIRVEIIRRLLAGQPYKRISEDLKVGIATVTRGGREIKLDRFETVKGLWRNLS